MYDTPAHLAKRLARHVPKRFCRLLDPSVGNGALLNPLLGYFKRHRPDVVCVDTNSKALNELRDSFRDCTFHSEYVNEDFLTWGIEQPSLSFDCVLMNPPFAGTRTACRTLNVKQSTADAGHPTGPVPVEAAFICVAHRLLAANGRLLAILPCSVIMSESLQWLRSFLLKTGSIEYVYEFPSRTFRTVDSKVYLLVFKKGPRRRLIRLIRPQSHRSRRHFLRFRDQAPHRLDFDFHSGRQRMRRLTSNTNLKWTVLGEVARIFRGTIPSAPRRKGVVHSTDFSQGRWRRPADESTVEATRGRIRTGDLLIRRVGRNSHLTLGDARSVTGLFATDCVFVIRPHDRDASQRLLFAIKALVGLHWLPPLLERGTGACYFCKSSLEQLPVPLAAPDAYSDSFLSFLQAGDADCVDCTTVAISSVTERLAPHSGESGSSQTNISSHCPVPEKHIPLVHTMPRN